MNTRKRHARRNRLAPTKAVFTSDTRRLRELDRGGRLAPATPAPSTAVYAMLPALTHGRPEGTNEWLPGEFFSVRDRP